MSNSEKPKITMPELGPNCADCPMFKNRCSAIVGMRAVAELATIVNAEEPLAPWASIALAQLGLKSGQDKPEEGSDIATISDAVTTCEGPISITRRTTPIPAHAYKYATPGSVVRRAPVNDLLVNRTDATKTVNIKLGEGGQIRNLETSTRMARRLEGTNPMDYEIKYPDRTEVHSPYGQINSTYVAPGGSPEVLQAATNICNTLVTDQRAVVLTPDQLRARAQAMEDANNNGGGRDRR